VKWLIVGGKSELPVLQKRVLPIPIITPMKQSKYINRITDRKTAGRRFNGKEIPLIRKPVACIIVVIAVLMGGFHGADAGTEPLDNTRLLEWIQVKNR
jgi:hypothetical protein